LTLEAWLQNIAQQHPKQIDLGLDRIASVVDRLGWPKTPEGVSLGCPVIVVGGTNGKGSTCAFLTSILHAAGYRVACYTSPHLVSFNERLTFNLLPADDDQWLAGLQAIEASRGETSLTYFEVVTLAAFQLIRDQAPDVAILEVGLGGRLDAVNIVASDAAVLTSIDLDHQAYLGHTREEIGWEKAHIARPHRPLICADPVVPETVLRVAADIGADLWRLGQDFNFQGDRQQWSWAGRGVRRHAMAYPSLRGANQLLNASAAIAALTALRHQLPVNQGAIRQGLLTAELPGRFQVLPGQPQVVLDVAHNPHAAGVLAANLDQMGFFPETYAVFGMLADKDAAAVIRQLGERMDHWCLTSLTGPDAGARGQTAAALGQTLKSVLPDADQQCFDSPEAAYAAAVAAANPNDRIVVFGSFLTVAQVIKMRHVRR